MYSQNEEEKYIIDALARHSIAPKDCRVLDVGAWHPKTFSNSRALIEAGATAVLIEPSPTALEALLKEYGYVSDVVPHPYPAGRIQIVSAAVAPANGWASLVVSHDAVSTISEGNAKLWADRAAYYGELIVPTITWTDIWNRFGGFNFINIDAEGISAELFIELMNGGAAPEVVCVEHDSRHVELGASAARRGYHQVYVSGENCVFSRG